MFVLQEFVLKFGHTMFRRLDGQRYETRDPLVIVVYCKPKVLRGECRPLIASAESEFRDRQVFSRT